MARRRRPKRRRGRAANHEKSLEGPTPWEYALEITLGAIVVVGVMAIGTLHAGTLFVLAGVSIGCALLGWKVSPRARVPAAAWLCAGLAGWSALQAIPLPMGMLTAIAPSNADIWTRSVEAMSTAAPAYASISLDPGASWREACRWTSYACVVFATTVVVHRRGKGWGPAIVFGSGVALAVVTVMHGLAGLTRVWGFYTPDFNVKPWHLGPLLNPNSLAGYLNLAFLAGLGLVWSQRTNRRAAIIPGLVVVVAVAVLSASRAGVALLPVGVVALGLIVWRWRRTREPKRVLGVAVGALAAGGALAFVGGTASAWGELFSTSVEKLSMIDWLLPMLQEHAWVGIGRGAFESVSAAYMPLSGHVRFTHAEIFPIQWAIEWGIPVAAFAILAFGFLLRTSRLKSMSTSALGLYVGLVLLLIQNLTELGLEVPGVMFAVAVAFGTLAESKSPTTSRRVVGLRPASALAAAAALALVLAVAFGRRDLDGDRRDMRASAEAITTANMPPGGFPTSLAAAVSRHPAEPYFPLLGALVAFHQSEPVMPWLQRALERGVNDGRAHLLLAHYLARRGAQQQAIMELRLAVERDTLLREEAANLAVRLSTEGPALMRAVPDGSDGLRMLDALAIRLQGEHPTVSRAMDEEALRRDEASVSARVRLANHHITKLSSEEGCLPTPASCEEEVARHAAKLQEVAPDDSAASRVKAKLLAAQGKHDEAAELLVGRCDTVTDRRRCWRAAVMHAAKGSQAALLHTAAEKSLAEACGVRTRCAAMAEWLGKLHVPRRNWGAAMMYYQRAVSEEVTVERLLGYANVARRAGSAQKARRALKRALALYPNRTAEIKKQLEQLP